MEGALRTTICGAHACENRLVATGLQSNVYCVLGHCWHTCTCNTGECSATGYTYTQLLGLKHCAAVSAKDPQSATQTRLAKQTPDLFKDLVGGAVLGQVGGTSAQDSGHCLWVRHDHDLWRASSRHTQAHPASIRSVHWRAGHHTFQCMRFGCSRCGAGSEHGTRRRTAAPTSPPADALG